MDVLTQVFPDDPVAFPVLSDAEMRTLRRFGQVRSVGAGEVLQRVGDIPRDLYVVISGGIEVLTSVDGNERIVRRHGPGGFLGELSLLTGQRIYIGARTTAPGELLQVPHDAFRHLIATEPEVSDVLLKAFMARRAGLITLPQSSLRIFGSSFSPECLRLREFVARNRLIHQWIDIETSPDAGRLMEQYGLSPDDLPVVVAGEDVVRRATPGMLSSMLGLTLESIPERFFDLVVVGAGPAGLAASVYGASEGLSTLTLEAIAIGGQSGSSSRIENYLGFPTGVSGTELANLAMVQALKFDAHFSSPCSAVGLSGDGGHLVVRLSDGEEVAGRALVIATGARYRRLPIPELAAFEDAGVYYAATEIEARQCAGARLVVVGGGNSAGQAAMFLAANATQVILAIRGDDLGKNMSSYLVNRIVEHPRIEVRTLTQVTGLHGEHGLEAVTLSHRDGRSSTIDCSGVFSFIGADAGTDWLSPCASLDDAGFIRTDRSVDRLALDHQWAALGRDPLPFETGHPGLFAVGDVRSGSVKRVAAAVGEGSAAIRSVHEHLAFAH